ncbi:MAG: hypothetical protein IJY63_01150 [Clostridia bacterium]|nr:hypothetical protein [Clostridia bacterium]
MKQLKNRWENELNAVIPPLSADVMNAEIPTKETQSSIANSPSSNVVSRRNKLWQKRGFWVAVSGGVACACALAIILPNALKDPATGVSADEMRVMNVSCNPSVEFVLGTDDVVISANALNEEGNLIVSAETFVGKSAEDAVYLFAEIAQESGFIVSGKAELVGANNKISIAFSGDENAAEELFNAVRGRVEDYFADNLIVGAIEKAESIDKEDLDAILRDCMLHISDEEIEKMDYAAVMETLAQTRKETANIYSQELKSAYYEMKSFAMEQAELDAVKANADAITSIVLDGVYAEYTKAIADIEKFRMEYLVNEDSPYQQALTAFRAAKVEYLQYRSEVAQMTSEEISEEILDVLVTYEQTLETLQSELQAIGERAHKDLDALKAQVETIFNGINDSLQGLGIDKETIAESITAERDKAEKGFLEYFEVKCEKEIGAAHDRWTEMKGELGKDKRPAPEGGDKGDHGEKFS